MINIYQKMQNFDESDLELENQPSSFTCAHCARLNFQEIIRIITMRSELSLCCSNCGCSGDNWICLICLEQFCSPGSSFEHITHHYDDIHNVAFCINDGTCWCNSCYAYIESEELSLFYEAFKTKVLRRQQQAASTVSVPTLNTLYTFSIGDDDENGFEDEEDSNYLIRSDLASKTLSRRTTYARTTVFVLIIISLTALITAIYYITHRSDNYMDEEEASLPEGRPNFVLIIADDLGWNSIGHNNYNPNLYTPFLDSLAQQGIVLTNYYSQEMCSPARAALYTGRLPSQVGMQYGVVHVTAEDEGLPVEQTLLPAALREFGGYATYLIGKWHLGHSVRDMLPTSRGFDAFIGFLAGQEYFWTKSHPDYSEEYHDFIYADTHCYDKYNASDMFNYSTFFYRDRAVNTILAHDFREKPLFLVYASQAVHEPAVDRATYQDGIPVDYLGEEVYNNIKANVIGDTVQQYAMSLFLLDQAVSSIHDALIETEQLDNTYIIFVSDNGGCPVAGGRNGPLRGRKGTLFEGGTKVDAFIFSPLLYNGTVDRTYNGLMHVSDWFPTILYFANITDYLPTTAVTSGDRHLSGITGYNQASAMTGSTPQISPRQHLLYNTYHNVQNMHFNIHTNGTFAVRDTRYKLMHAWDGSESSQWYSDNTALLDDDVLVKRDSCFPINTTEGVFTYFLFDLWTDPHETNNLYHNSSYLVTSDSLYELINTYNNEAVLQLHSVGGSNDSEVLALWSERGHFFQPWRLLDEDKDSVPNLCSNPDNIFAPK